MQALITSFRQPLSLLLKLCPLVDELALYDVVNTPGVAADISHISSKAVRFTGPMPPPPKRLGTLTFLRVQKVTGYVPPKDAPRGDMSQAKVAFKDADIIVIPAGIPRTYAAPVILDSLADA